MALAFYVKEDEVPGCTIIPRGHFKPDAEVKLCLLPVLHTSAPGSLVFALVHFDTEHEGVKKCPYSCYMKWQKLSDGNRNWEGGGDGSVVTHCLTKKACTRINERSSQPGSFIEMIQGWGQMQYPSPRHRAPTLPQLKPPGLELPRVETIL